MENLTFLAPQREIGSVMDMGKWQKSQAYRDFLGFVLTLNESIKGQALEADCTTSKTCALLVSMLGTLESWISDYPPIDQPQRFGNKAYRDWSKHMNENSNELIEPLLPEQFKLAAIELKAYLADAFGNATRIDYGTGHEASFIAFLCCLYKLKLLDNKDNVALVNKVFARYLKLMRKLQLTYHMEPAGSQGVWGLDDFQFIPFIWGSAQLIDHPDIVPSHIPNQQFAEKFSKAYMLFGCVEFINTVKSGPFAEHSNVLWSVSSVPNWSKVNAGLIKMYKAEVLAKFPVIQHFVFGTLLSIKPAV